MTTTTGSRRQVGAAFLALALMASACGSDDGEETRGEVTEIGDDGQAAESGSSPGSASGSASAPAGDENAEPESTPGDGGYEYASDVVAHRLVVADICGIADLLDVGDFAGVEAIYRDGVNSVNGDGSIRSIGGFAVGGDHLHGLDAYYGSAAPLDEFVTAALEGTGPFEGQPDAVRAQGVEKGIQNQVMVAWVIHELASAIGKAGEGNFDVAEGAVHNWDEAWAFYHGSEPACSPFATGNMRAGNFGTFGADGETAAANELILAAMISGRGALLEKDPLGAEMAAADVFNAVVIIYSQASIRYASLIDGDIAEGDLETAKVHQAEGLAFFRVIEALIAEHGGDVDAINSIYELANGPGSNGGGAAVRVALAPAWEALGITDADIGELE
jgi:hypothetical protein